MSKFIQSIIAFSLGNRLFICLCTIGLIVMGSYAFKQTPIDAFPDVTNTQITIISQWPGRSAEEIEKQVTIPIEIAMNAVAGKTDIRSTTLFGLSVVKIIFEDKIEDFLARWQVGNFLHDVSFPEGVLVVVQPAVSPTGEIFRYTLHSNSHSVRELKTLQDGIIEKKLRSVPGLSDLISFGGEVKTFEVSVQPQKLRQYDLTALAVYNALAQGNVNVGGDIINKAGQAYVVRGIGLLNNIAEIENIVLANRAGVPILVRHVAQVSEQSLPRLGFVGRDMQPDVVQGICVMRKGEDASKVLKDLKAKIAQVQAKSLPEGVSIVPFYDRSKLTDLAVRTVSQNLVEGMILVTVLVFVFMASWRSTLLIALIIPLSLLFAFICLYLMNMPANLLSMGAIDFGIIIDGAVVMVEGLFVSLDHRAKKLGMKVFNQSTKLGLLKNTASGLGKSIFAAKLIIIIALLPIFFFQKVEGKLFSPLAFTLGFALLGALILSLTLVPVLASFLFNKNVQEKHQPWLLGLSNQIMHVYDWVQLYPKRSLAISFGCLALVLGSFRYLGTEFLPQLDEGSIYIRAALPMSISLEESVKITQQLRQVIGSFDAVAQVLSQTGRPNDGTDATGFYNIEFHVDMKPKKDQARPESKAILIQKLEKALAIYPGINLSFSQPIMDNVEEAVSGIKGSIAVKIFGDNLQLMTEKAEMVQAQLLSVQGIVDVGIIQSIGQPELSIMLDEYKLGVYGIEKQAAQAVIEMAIGGRVATEVYQGEQKFAVVLRYQEAFRKSEQEIGQLLIPALNGQLVPLKQIADLILVEGPALLFREAHQRFIAIKFAVRGRDMGSAIQEAQKKVAGALTLPKGINLKWTGDFENQQRASARLTQIVPLSILIIGLVLFMLTQSLTDSLLILANVPFAMIGGIASLWITGTNFSISAGIGFIALFGICIQDGVILLTTFKQNRQRKLALDLAIREGVKARIRPVLMTALMAAIGLLPAATAIGIGSETARPLARVIIGGLVTATLLSLFILPLLFGIVYRRKE